MSALTEKQVIEIMVGIAKTQAAIVGALGGQEALGRVFPLKRGEGFGLLDLLGRLQI
jgi:hypothetical protein